MPIKHQTITYAAMRRAGGRGKPSSHAAPTSAGTTAAFSLARRASVQATALPARLSRATASQTASTEKTAAMSSARPTTFATASTWTGWTANRAPASQPAASPAQRRARRATAVLAPACQRTLTPWNHHAPAGATPRALFPSRVGSPAVGDRHPPDARPRLRQPRGDLHLEAEPVGREGQAPQQVGAHQLVARLHVGEVEIGEHVGEEGEEPVADGVPEVEDAMRAALEPRAEHGVGASVGDGGQARRELAGIVVAVC